MIRQQAKPRVNVLDWLKDPNRKPYRVNARERYTTPGNIWIARRGDLVLGSADTQADALAIIDNDIARPWARAGSECS